MTSTSPRIPPVPVDELTSEQKALVGDYAGLNFSRVMVRHPDLYRAFMPFGEQLMARTSLGPRDRQILILRTCALCNEEYETAHHAHIARNVGLSLAEIKAAQTGGAGLPAADEVLLRLAEELVRDRIVGDTGSGRRRHPADHGIDPTKPGSDHTREYTPLLVYSPSRQGGVDLGIRESFADIAATIADHFQIDAPGLAGTSFLSQLPRISNLQIRRHSEEGA